MPADPTRPMSEEDFEPLTPEQMKDYIEESLDNKLTELYDDLGCPWVEKFDKMWVPSVILALKSLLEEFEVIVQEENDQPCYPDSGNPEDPDCDEFEDSETHDIREGWRIE